MKGNVSPEEKLLRLIRGEKKGSGAVSSPVNLKASAGKKAAFKLGIPSFIRNLTARKIIFIILVLSCLYFIFVFIYPLIALRKVKLPEITKEKGADLEIAVRPEQKPLEDYLTGVAGKQMFGSVPSAGVSGPASGVAADLVKDINLVGIISGVNPQAIIEDKKTQKTYYLNKGQFIGEFQVEDIQDGKIILNYNGQRFELHL
jgi:type II secretory pathway component PulC